MYLPRLAPFNHKVIVVRNGWLKRRVLVSVNGLLLWVDRKDLLPEMRSREEPTLSSLEANESAAIALQKAATALGLPQASSFLELTRLVYAVGEQARPMLGAVEDEVLHHSYPTTQNYDHELIQVAAVAVAAITDKRLSEGWNADQLETVLYYEIIAERLRQDMKFGQMPRHLNPLVWIGVLAEEIAEVSAEIEIS